MPGAWDHHHLQAGGRGVVLGLKALHRRRAGAVVRGHAGAEQIVVLADYHQDRHGNVVGGLLGRGQGEQRGASGQQRNGDGVLVRLVGRHDIRVRGGRAVEQRRAGAGLCGQVAVVQAGASELRIERGGVKICLQRGDVRVKGVQRTCDQHGVHVVIAGGAGPRPRRSR